MVKLLQVSIIAAVIISGTIYANTFQVDAEGDARYMNEEFREYEAELHRAALGMRQVFSDKGGDRLILMGRVESEHNFSETAIEQLFAQYKGPMGKWNIMGGRFLVPFGLNLNYETEPLLIESLEEDTMGNQFDSGLNLSGQIKNFDYSLSVTQGIGKEQWVDNNYNKLVTFRTGISGDDFEDFNIGLSGMIGTVYIDENNFKKKLLAIDGTKYYGLFVFRGEASGGMENNEYVYGLFLGLDYRFLPSLDLNTALRIFRNRDFVYSATVGISYFTPLWGFVLRAAHRLTFGESKNESFIQIYNKYSFNI